MKRIKPSLFIVPSSPPGPVFPLEKKQQKAASGSVCQCYRPYWPTRPLRGLLQALSGRRRPATGVSTALTHFAYRRTFDSTRVASLRSMPCHASQAYQPFISSSPQSINNYSS